MTPHVLLVEDVEDNRELARLLLEVDGFAVTEAHNGQDALDLAGRTPFDLILMDLSLPVMDGWEALRRLREAGLTAVPIVALTAHAMSGDRERALAAGFDGYIPKPIDVGGFAREVRRALR